MYRSNLCTYIINVAIKQTQAEARIKAIKAISTVLSLVDRR
jgi:hypothetical protein